MMYELAIHSLDSAIAHLKSGDAMARAKSVTKAQEAIDELTLSVDHSCGAAFTTTLVELYAYVRNEIVKGHTEQSEAAFLNAIAILKTLREGWEGLQAQQAAGGGSVEDDSAVRRPVSAYGQDLAERTESRDWTC